MQKFSGFYFWRSFANHSMENLASTLPSPIPSPIPQTESDLSLVVVGSTPFSPMSLFSVENSVAAASAATIQMLPPPEISVSSESTSLPPIPYSNLTKSAKLHISVDSKSIMFDTDFERAETTEWVRQVSSINFQMLDHRDFITVDGALYIDMLFSMEESDIDLLEVKTPWREQDRKAFCKRLLLAMSDISSGRAMEMSFLEKIKAFEVAFDLAPNGLSIEKKTCLQLHKLVDNHTFITAAEDKAAYGLLYGKLTEKWKSCYDRSKLFLERSDIGTSTVKDFTIHL